MAKKKTETEEKAEPKVKQKKDKIDKVVEVENSDAKSAVAEKKSAAKTSKPDSPEQDMMNAVKSKSAMESIPVVEENNEDSNTESLINVEEVVSEPVEPSIVNNQDSLEEVKEIEIEPTQEVDESPKVEIPKPKEISPAQALNPSVRYTDEDLQEFAILITQEKETALEELRMLKERLDDLTSFDAADESMIYSMHMAEQGSEAQEKEKTYAQIQRIHEYIKKLEESMERIKNKTYGICRVCGCLIAKARLRAVPITTLSASYKIHQKCPDDGIDKIEPVKK